MMRTGGLSRECLVIDIAMLLPMSSDSIFPDVQE
jgi:hypothetical protein